MTTNGTIAWIVIVIGLIPITGKVLFSAWRLVRRVSAARRRLTGRIGVTQRYSSIDQARLDKVMPGTLRPGNRAVAASLESMGG